MSWEFVRPEWYNIDDYGREEDRPLHHCAYHHLVCETLHEDLDVLKNKNIINHHLHHYYNDHKDRRKKNERNMMITRPYSSFGRNCWGMNVRVGDTYDIPSLLTSSSRDYLIKNNGHKVQIQDHFSGKRVLLLFWNLDNDGCLPHEGNDGDLCADTREIYCEYRPLGQFEIVFIALGDNHKVFNEAFSYMPWLAIPHQDHQGRVFIEKEFDIQSSPLVRSLLFDVDGTLLLDNCKSSFRCYGPQGFPFTREKIDEIIEADDALTKEVLSSKKLPLQKLLGEFVVSSEGKKISTSDLEAHVVGLYFLNTSTLDDPSTEALINSWKVLKDDPNIKFSIVSINDASTCLSDFIVKYQDKHRDIHWYRLPFDGRMLCRVLRIRSDGYDNLVCLNTSWNAGRFIIIEPDRYQPFNYFALDVIEIYGIDAFPFTLERVMEIEKKKLQNWELSKLLSPSTDLRTGCSNSYKKVTLSDLLGNRVILLFATNSCYEVGSFLPTLRRMYLEKQGTPDQFEILYMSLDCEYSNKFSRSIENMPWLVHPYVPDFAMSLAEMVFGSTPRVPAIVAFGSDGSLQSMESNLLFKETWNTEYPFIQVDMDDHICRELVDGNKWDLKNVFPDLLLAK